MSYRWFLVVPAVIAIFPQIITRNGALGALFGSDLWAYRGVRIAAFCTFCVFALYFFMQSKA